METMAEILYWGLEARGTVEDFEKEKLLEKRTRRKVTGRRDMEEGEGVENQE